MNVSARRRTFIAAGIVAVLILAGVGYAAWEVFGGSAPPAATLERVRSLQGVLRVLFAPRVAVDAAQETPSLRG